MDIVIVGAGISGLYLGIELLKNGHNVTIIERTRRLGGRIDTRKFMNYNFEAGAGRYSNNHKLLLELIERYNLTNIKIPSGNKELVQYYKVISDSLKNIKHDLSKATTWEYLIALFGEDRATKFRILYGYDGDLLLSSALCGTNILMDDYKSKQYYVLKGGLDTLVAHMANEYKSMGGQLMFRKKISTIDRGNDYYKLTGPTLDITCHKLVLAIPPSALGALYPTRDIREFNFIKHITPVPLLRIYFLYNKPQAALGGLHKHVSDLDIRFIIPVNNQIIMISYSDYKLANKWKTLYEKDIEKFYEKILREFTTETGRILPKPDNIAFEYWSEGVYVWNTGFDYLANYSKILQPLGGLYLSNEAYSKRQGWIEGSLEMARDVSLSIG
jgi:protoporphyrinogen oxidase